MAHILIKKNLCNKSPDAVTQLQHTFMAIHKLTVEFLKKPKPEEENTNAVADTSNSNDSLLGPGPCGWHDFDKDGTSKSKLILIGSSGARLDRCGGGRIIGS